MTRQQIPPLPPNSSLPNLTTEELVRVMDYLFEPSVSLRSLCRELLTNEPSESYDDFVACINKKLSTLARSEAESDITNLNSIVGAHPRLGEGEHNLSQESSVEQRHLQTSREADELMEWNRTYERTFPGLRYITFVNRRSKSVLVADIRSRIDQHDEKAERISAVQALCEIAMDRVRRQSPAFPQATNTTSAPAQGGAEAVRSPRPYLDR